MKTYIDTSLSLREVMEKYSLSKSTAWRAKNRGWYNEGYHTRKSNVGKCIEVSEEIRNNVEAYATTWASRCKISIQDKEDVIQNTFLYVLNNSDRMPKEPKKLQGWVVAILKTQISNYEKQGFQSLVNGVENWDYNK